MMHNDDKFDSMPLVDIDIPRHRGPFGKCGGGAPTVGMRGGDAPTDIIGLVGGVGGVGGGWASVNDRGPCTPGRMDFL